MNIYCIVIVVFLNYVGALLLDFFEAEGVSESEIRHLLVIIFKFVRVGDVKRPSLVNIIVLYRAGDALPL